MEYFSDFMLHIPAPDAPDWTYLKMLIHWLTTALSEESEIRYIDLIRKWAMIDLNDCFSQIGSYENR